MIRCQDIIEESSEFHDQDLAPERRSDYERHLEICTPCRSFYRTFEATIRTARQVLLVEPPPELEDALLRELRARWRQGA